MNRSRLIVSLLAAAAVSTAAAPLFAQQPEPTAAKAVAADTVADTIANKPHQSIGLVLSGGGARGIAHIGVIKALEDNDIPIDYIAGTSMGAIVGSLYSMGYTPEEMMALLQSKEFSYWSSGQINPNYGYYFSRETPTPSLFSIPLAKKETPADSVPASLINPNPMSFGFMELFSAANAQCKGNFNNLFVPFRCVASDVAAQHKVVHATGPLGEAVRSSMSFPIVFQPIRMNGALLYDGGIFDNFPVDVMKEDFAPDFMLGVTVNSGTHGPQTSLYDQIDNLVTRQQHSVVPPKKGIRIAVNAHQFGLLDWGKAQDIYTMGYNTTMAMMDSIKGRIHTRRPRIAVETARGAFRSQTPYLRFDSVEVTGATPKQNRFIANMFRPRHDTDTFGITSARAAYYRAMSSGRLSELYPTATYNSANGLFKLNLRAAPKQNFALGIGGYITSATSSYLFFSAGYRTLSFSSISANINGWIGQTYMGGELNARLNFASRIPSALSLTAVAGRQNYHETEQLFFEDKIPSFIINYEYYALLKYTWAAGRRGRFLLGTGFGHIRDSFYPDNADVSYRSGRDKATYNLGQLRLGYEGSTLDDMNFPTSGSSYSFTGMGVLGKMHFTPFAQLAGDVKFDNSPKWLQLESVTRNYFSGGAHFSFGVESDIMLSTRKLTRDFNASLTGAPAFHPTTQTYNSFNPSYHANSFAALSLVPIYKYNSNISARLVANGYVPIRPILPGAYGEAVHGDWFSRPVFFSELDLCYTLPFATLNAYANYTSAGTRPWNFGIAIGVFILPKKFLR